VQIGVGMAHSVLLGSPSWLANLLFGFKLRHPAAI